MVEQTAGMTRAQRDRERSTPRETVAPLGHPRKARPMPVPDAVRTPLSARQRNTRRAVRRQVTERLSGTQHEEMRKLLTSSRGRWQHVNDQLSDTAGDIQQLPERDITRIQRIDRAIQSYEAGNDRTHIVYAATELPRYVNHANITGYVAHNFTPGQELTFDRYTASTHQLHETEQVEQDPGRTVVFEMQTGRGMYVGQGGSGHTTAHLLPRGLRSWVVGSHQASYQRPDGSRGTRTVVQLRDTPPEQPPAPTRRSR